MNDKTLGAYERNESPDYADGGVAAALIEKEAEQPTGEVRELRSALAREVARGNALQDALDAAEPRPLTPDAITDEMVERAADRFRELDLDHEISEMDLVRGTIIAALAEPPARPEGAEDIEAVLREEWTFSDEDGGEDAFADLAARLAQRGVRVDGGEDSR